MSDDETLQGALNRVQYVREQQPDSLVIAIEGGIATRPDTTLECFAWCAVRSPVTGAHHACQMNALVAAECALGLSIISIFVNV